MKFRLSLAVFALLNVFSVTAATVSLYVNSTTVQSPPDSVPQIDATTFVNDGYFEVSDFSASPLPYQSANTRHFRNEPSRLMFGHPGYNFEYVSGNTRQRMTTWMNRGTISSFPSNRFFFPFNTANWLLVSSESITNTGSLNADEFGLIRLTGNTINLTRSRIRAGAPLQAFAFGSGGSYLYWTNYFNDPGITDVYWGAGSNNVVSGTGPLMQLDGITPNLSVTNLRSAQHQIIQPFGSFLFTNFTTLPAFGFFGPKGVMASAYSTTNQSASLTQVVVQIVFVATNSFDTNLTPEITFFPDFFSGAGATVQVGFHSTDRDVALDQAVVSSLYVLDGMALRTNVTLIPNGGFGLNGRRPDTYEVTKAPFFFASGQPANTSLGDYPAYRSGYASNAVPVTYAAYSARLTANNFTASDPTNYPGRVEIIGQDVNMREARIRAESTFILTAANLVSNNQARVSAPFMNFDIATTQPQLVVSNLAPSTVNRLSGTVAAWSAMWDNTDTNNGAAIRFHVLIVDHNLQSTMPATVSKFLGRGTNVVLHDFLSVNQRLRLDTTSLHVKSNGGLAFPPNWSWGSSNMQNIVNYTNEGTVTVPGRAVLGPDKAIPYATVINRGSQTAQAQSITANYFENSGSMLAQGGDFTLNSPNVVLNGRPIAREVQITAYFTFNPFRTNYVTNLVFTGGASITSRGDLNITANTLTLSNALLQAGDSAPGAIILNATTRLTDSGPRGTNYWIASGGIRVMQRPPTSDLMATYATVKAPSFEEVQSIWAGNDLGAVSLGYNNNLALGKLTLDGGTNESLIRFSPSPGKTSAIYVDYLELLNNATNIIIPGTGLQVDPNMTIYFAHANIEASKLDGLQDNRIRWVKGFTGPLSTTNMVYPSGNVYPVNISLARHKDFDSDGDGTPNYKDRTPIYTAENINLAIDRDVQPNRVLLSWRGLANATSRVEYKPVIASTGPWQVLGSASAPSNTTMTMTDITTGAGRTQRIYRVRVDLPPQ